MRRLFPATACALLLTLGAAGCGGGDERPIPTVAANDPVSLLCDRLPGLARQSCESSYFSCRDHSQEIRQESDVARKADPRTTSVAYAKAYWSDWERPVRDAARRGCRAGLGDHG